MKKSLALLTGVMLFCCSYAYSATALRTGTYALYGTNPDSTSHYQGEVTISPQGSNYHLVWTIGRSQAQTGVGILSGNILSVAYADNSGRDFGAVSFEIAADGHLEGRWSSMNGTTCGHESLTWKRN